MPSNPCHPSVPIKSLAILTVPSIHMHWQVVYTGCATSGSFLVGAAAHPGQKKLGRRAATLPSSTELMYIFFAVGSMCLLPASGLLIAPFAPARRAHPATGRPALVSSLFRCCTPPWRPPCGRGRRSRASPGRGPSCGASSGSEAKISAPAAGAERSWRPPDGAVGAIVCGNSYRVGGYF